MRAGRLARRKRVFQALTVLKTREQRARDFAVACMPWRAVKTLAAVLMPKKGSEAATRLDARGFAGRLVAFLPMISPLRSKGRDPMVNA